MKYHITNKGEVKVCLATIKMCKYGSENHFSSVEQGNMANDLVLNGKAKSYSEAKSMILKEFYRKKRNETFDIVSKNNISSPFVTRTITPLKFYDEEINNIKGEIDELKAEKNSLTKENNELYKNIEIFNNDNSRAADIAVKSMYEKSVKNDKNVDEIAHEIQRKNTELSVYESMKKDANMYYQLANDNNSDLYVRNAKDVKIGKEHKQYLEKIIIDDSGNITNLFFQDYNKKITPITEITEDNRFLNNFKDINIEKGFLFTIEKRDNQKESYSIIF